ncbi:hypothetical protein [Limnohabitans sp.]|jgi:hypothetical protein|uniref:hypothetical protein n=1 Tax=Limnohabitans sp. TaxID=1907725 RepID=UPI0037BFD89A
MTTPNNQPEWDEATDPLPKTWDELMKDFPPVSLVERLQMISRGESLPPHPKVQAFIERGGARLRDALCNTPFWAEGERKAFEAGGQERVDQYWQNLFMNERNLHRPPKPKV